MSSNPHCLGPRCRIMGNYAIWVWLLVAPVVLAIIDMARTPKQ